MKKKQNKKVRFLSWLLAAAGAFAILCAGFVLLVPFLVTVIPIPEIEYDLAPYLGDSATNIVSSTSVTARIRIERRDGEGFVVSAAGSLLDWTYTASANVRFGFINAEGDISFSLDDSELQAKAEFAASGRRDWRFTARIPETHFSSDDAIIAQIIAKSTSNSISNLVFSGAFKLDAEGSCSEDRPVPSWKVRSSLSNAGISLETGGKPVRIGGLRLGFGMDGIANHQDISPLFPKADFAEFSGFTLSNLFASVRATERSYLVTEAGASCCGGELKLYSLFLDPKSLSLGATVFVDGVDAGQALSHMPSFHGEASGRLHGKLPFFLKDGKTLRFKNAHLFSTPGETGNIRIENPAPILDNLAAAGIPESDRSNLAKALENLDYTVLKIELKKGDGDDDMALGLKLEGTATRGKTTVPVNLTITFHGDLEDLVDTGMGLSRRKIR